ncbi:asparagine synthase-related protein [Qipengyuania sphaerica]|uniref:asparagine synthase-related protein n=1 Tax=Qipengyuania sphaerica TaxID=2867243 RepID=UPI001C889FCD|nr:asparagine synthase-related protein [Qipengyuania sphaerica]MBX7541612.1 hypothetical protein [Qipengyuania sphaerica]
MIAAVRRAGGLEPPVLAAVGRALGDDPRQAPPHCRSGEFDLWSDSETGSGTLFFGRIDNRADSARELGLPRDATPAAIYSAALERWGDAADLKLVGHYCAISLEGPGRLRLVRSPWTAPPMHFVANREVQAASPLLGALFAAGVEKRIDWDYLTDQLAYAHHDCEPVGWFRGIGRVPLGSRVRIDCAEWRLERYYDPTEVPSVRFARDDDYVARAWELLGEAARGALAGVERPAIMLSGGLDSPLAAAALLGQMPVEQRLHSYTFGPHQDWDGWVPPNRFGDEREMVRRFAAMHPRIEAHFPAAEGGHDHRLRDLLSRSEVPTANIANIGIFHPLLEAARADGCDAMFTALHGNFNISMDAGWAAPESLRKGKLRQLRRLLADATDEHEHSQLRKLLSMAVLPHLPAPLQKAIRKFAHPERFGDIPLGSLLSEEAAAKWRGRGVPSAFDRPPIPATRKQAIRTMWASADSGEDLDLGLGRLHGLAHRDVTAYRPLFEFCHGLPTDQLRRGGTDRYLARRVAEGIMPEEQRHEVRQGRHNVDWHARLTRQRAELVAQSEAIRAHRELSEILDIDRMQRLLADWPETTPGAAQERLPREMGLTRALTAASFVSHAEKRNDF